MRSRAVGLALVLATSGCGVMMRQPPDPNRQVHDTPRCSEGYGGVVLDGLFVTAYGLTGLTALSEDEGGLAFGTLLVGGIHLASAIAGHRSARRCKAARDAHDAWLASERSGKKVPVSIRVRPGSRSGPCYDDETCDEGLACHPDAGICVLVHFAEKPSKPTETESEEQGDSGLIVVDDFSEDETAAFAGDETQEGVAPAPAAEPDDAEEPAARKTPVAGRAPAQGSAKARPVKRRGPTPGAWFYRDFWREVKP